MSESEFVEYMKWLMAEGRHAPEFKIWAANMVKLARGESVQQPE